VDEELGIYRGEVEAIMLARIHLGEKVDTILRYIEGRDADDEEETEPPDA
jgi:hypothetical protein